MYSIACGIAATWRVSSASARAFYDYSMHAVADEAMRIVDIAEAILPRFSSRFRLADVSAFSISLLFAEEKIVDRIIV